MLDVDDIDRMLEQLGTLLAERSESTVLFVVGGAALSRQRVVIRPTIDIDVLARVSGANDAPTTLQLEYASPLSEPVLRAVAEIADQFGLPRNWLNDTVATPPPLRLLPGAAQRATLVEYADGALVVYFMGRLDAICMKLLAAADRDGFDGRDLRHLNDLRALQPSNDELRQAEAWCAEQEAPQSAGHALRRAIVAREFGLTIPVEDH